MNYNGLQLEPYAFQRDSNSTIDDDVCSVRACFAGPDQMKNGKRIDGYAFCDAHAAQIPHIDKPFAYHRPSVDGFERITKLRVAFSDLKARIEQICPESRHRSVALTELETAAMWAIKAVVFNDPNSEVEGQ